VSLFFPLGGYACDMTAFEACGCYVGFSFLSYACSVVLGCSEGFTFGAYGSLLVSG